EESLQTALARRGVRWRLVFQLGAGTPAPGEFELVGGGGLGGGESAFRRWALGAAEKNPPAIGDGIAHRLQRAVQHRYRLGEIDDVDVVAGAEDVLRHLRIPAVGLMAEVDASLQQLAHGEVRNRHSLFSG